MGGGQRNYYRDTRSQEERWQAKNRNTRLVIKGERGGDQSEDWRFKYKKAPESRGKKKNKRRKIHVLHQEKL